jgi:hypothetical protein
MVVRFDVEGAILEIPQNEAVVLAEDLRVMAAAGKTRDPAVVRQLADQVEERLVAGGDDTPIVVDDLTQFIALRNLGDVKDRSGGLDHVMALFRLARDWVGQEG